MTTESKILTKFSTLAGGVFVEITDSDRFEYEPTDRCFRFDDNGNTEYTYLYDLKHHPDDPRWREHQFKISNFILA